MEPWLRQERRVIREKQSESGHHNVVVSRSERVSLPIVDREVQIHNANRGRVERVAIRIRREGFGGDFEDEDGEGLEGRGGGEERGGEGGLRGGELVREVLEDGPLVDELVDVRDVGGSGEADAGEQRVAQ